MTKFEKLIQRIVLDSTNKNVHFEDLRKLLLFFGFTERIKGSHHIYFKAGIEEIINLQPSNGKAKPYQVKQVREILTNYKLINKDG